jgi:hypothetical protein
MNIWAAAMLSKLLVIAFIAGVALAVPSLDGLNSDVTILSDNDLQGKFDAISSLSALI